ncbi:hypothetical protein ACGFNU_16015 [Spirillospora sp. NPDC048911]|uniref:hypothetical protein n=1 Tax=Spirillospora sp. NPDC048911 TaxID=3364527 RepID=UPI003719A0F3
MLAVGGAITVVLVAATVTQAQFRAVGEPSPAPVPPRPIVSDDRTPTPMASMSSPPPPPTRAPSSPPARPGPTAPSSPPARATPKTTALFEVFSGADADGPSGGRRTAVLGGRTSTSSTTFWVGCEETPAVTRFNLRRAYTTLSTALILGSAAPAGLKVQVVLRGDGAVLERRVVARGAPASVRARVTGVRTLAVEATAIEGRCGTASVGYGIAYDAVLRFAG